MKKLILSVLFLSSAVSMADNGWGFQTNGGVALTGPSIHYMMRSQSMNLGFGAAIGSVSPFNIGANVNVRMPCMGGDTNKGMHWGGQVNLSYAGSFTYSIAGLMGFHFSVEKNIFLNFDAQLALPLTALGTTSFLPVNPGGAMSIHFML